MKKFKSLEDLWAYAKQVMPNGAVVSKIANTGASKFFSITVPRVLVQDPKLQKFSKIETVFTILKGDNLVDTFCEQTNQEYTIVDSNDFKEAMAFCAAMLNEGQATRRISLYEAVTKVMAPIKVGDEIKIVSLDGDVETDIVSGTVEDMRSLDKAVDDIKKDNVELYNTIQANGYKPTDRAYKIRGSWYIDDNEHNIYALLREARAESSMGYAITIAGTSYNSIWDIRKGLEGYEKDAQDKGKVIGRVVGNNSAYNMLKKTWNQIFAGSANKDVINEAAENNFKAIAIMQSIQNGTKDIPTNKFKSMIGSLSDFQKKLLSDPDADIKAIKDADDAIEALRKEFRTRGMKDGSGIK